jgi:hypothetical protein
VVRVRVIFCIYHVCINKMDVSSAQNQCDSSQAFNVRSVWSSQSPDAGPEIPSLSDPAKRH